MSDAPAMVCGEMCAGCTAECAACSAEMCADCGGCDHGRKMAQRGNAALALLRVALPDERCAEFKFNPLQRRGPDGRWVKMGGHGSAGAKRPAPLPRGVKKSRDGGYNINGHQRNWSPAEARAIADALDATADGQSVPAPVPGRVVAGRNRRVTVGQVQPFLGADGKVVLDVGRDSSEGDNGEISLSPAQARRMAARLRQDADRAEGRDAAPDEAADPDRFDLDKAPDIFRVLDGDSPPGTPVYEDGAVVLLKANEDGDLEVISRRTGASRTIRNRDVDAGTINEAIADTARTQQNGGTR